MHFQREKLVPSNIEGQLIEAFNKPAMDLVTGGKTSNNSSHSNINCWPDLAISITK